MNATTAPKELHLYDFDGTIYRSQLPPNALESTVWWHLPRSLDGVGYPGFDARWVLPVVQQARRSILDPRVMSVMLTGRPDHKAMRERVTRILHSAELYFPVMHLRPIVVHGGMAKYKANFVQGLLRGAPSIEKVVYFDDDPENLAEVGKVVGQRKYTGILGPGCY